MSLMRAGRITHLGVLRTTTISMCQSHKLREHAKREDALRLSTFEVPRTQDLHVATERKVKKYLLCLKITLSYGLRLMRVTVVKMRTLRLRGNAKMRTQSLYPSKPIPLHQNKIVLTIINHQANRNSIQHHERLFIKHSSFGPTCSSPQCLDICPTIVCPCK